MSSVDTMLLDIRYSQYETDSLDDIGVKKSTINFPPQSPMNDDDKLEKYSQDNSIGHLQGDRRISNFDLDLDLDLDLGNGDFVPSDAKAAGNLREQLVLQAQVEPTAAHAS